MEEQIIGQIEKEIEKITYLDNALLIVSAILFAFCMFVLLKRKKE